MLTQRNRQAGDTLVEAMVAISVLAVVLVSTFSLLSRGVAQMYDSMERSEVRMLLDRQTESLNYARDQYLQQVAGKTLAGGDLAAANAWASLKNETTYPSVTTVPSMESGCSDKTNAFYMTRDGGNNIVVSNSITGSGLASGFPAPGDGIWMQKIAESTNPVPYKDFFVRACWQSTGSTQIQVMSTVVRLYDRP